MLKRLFRAIGIAGVASLLIMAAVGCGGAKASSTTASDTTMKEPAALSEAELPPAVHDAEEIDHEFPEDAPQDMRSMKNPLGKGNRGDMEKGEALFQVNCVRCHGEKGNGKGPEAAGMTPAPADFTADHFAMMQDEVLYYIITTGITGSAMPSWAAIPSEDRWRIIHYLRSLAPKDAGMSNDDMSGHDMSDM